MQIRTIPERCNLCGLCVKECVAGVWRTVNGRPEAAAPGFCSLCGHCVAVCPKDAIVHEGIDFVQIRPVDRKRLDPDVFSEIVRSRRSIRRYKADRVPDAVIKDILGLCAWSPTASNKQDVAFTVITNKDVLQALSAAVFSIGAKAYRHSRKGPGKLVYRALQKLAPGNDLERYMEPMPWYLEQQAAGRDLILHNAPVLILVHAPKKGRFHCENCNIAAANIMNYAHARGLGTCYIGFVTLALKIFPGLRKLVSLPRGRRVYACLTMGYPAHAYARTTCRRPRPVDWVR
ncbi:MAG: nitroreductase family protein [Desulfosalsimonas sp.]|uniref:nitroreductase family protein n=1 Tax=Desulfosalsimonas sp. TaxID=3073848 RepID=UPI003970E8BD